MAATEWEAPVAEAIAAKLLQVEGIKSAKPLGDDNLAKLPGALVLLPDLTKTKEAGNWEEWQADYPVIVVHDIRQSVDATLRSLTTVAGRIRIAWWTGITLGLPYVLRSSVTSITPELFELGGDELPAHRLNVRVVVTEQDSRTA